MSALTKKPRIKEYEQIKILMPSLQMSYTIPKDQEAALQTIIVQAIHSVGGKEETSWRELFKDTDKKSAAIGGIEKYRDVALLIKSLREEAPMTQVELAEKLNVTQPYISDIERATKAIGKKVAKKLGQIFKVEARLFLTDI